MRYVDAEIWLALKARIGTLVTEPVLPVFDPGGTITIPKDATGPLPFIITSDVRNDPVRTGIDASLHSRSGTLMLAIQWPIVREISHAQLMQLGGAVSDHFPADQRMKYGATCLRVTQDSAPMQPYREGAFHVVMMRVFWSTV